MKEHFARHLLALMLFSMLLSSQAIAQPFQPARTECIGYQTIGAPGSIEYATLPPNISPTDGAGYGFGNGVGAWKTYQLVDTEEAYSMQRKAPEGSRVRRNRPSPTS